QVFIVKPSTIIMVESTDPEDARVARMMAERFKTAAGITLDVKEIKKRSTPKNAIIFRGIDQDTTLGKEGYTLSVSKDNIIIKAATAAGLFYGMQSVFQLLPPQIEGNSPSPSIKWAVPGVEIMDRPRFAWRGMHLDVCRHFMPLDFIKKYIDNMAMHKLNTFHWHLTEDQGWRIEIKKYPRLTEVGAWRKETLIGHVKDKPHEFDGIRHGGYYTQEEAKEIVRYAKDKIGRA